jgi:catechol 2,3-dioxygenase-like lactoylglutathione lyase family enzyme
MPARINHVAICSDYYATNARFYEALFGMRGGSKPRPARAVSLGDGHVGLNNIPRRDGRRSGLDHFGIEVDDIETTLARMKAFDPTLETVKRPAVRPYAAYSTHDPDANVFDLSQKNIGVQKDVFAENEWEQPRFLSHITLRTRHPERCAAFYEEVFDLRPTTPGDGAFGLSDGRVTLVILPWHISDYLDQDPAPVGLEHIGFTVENLGAFRHDLDEIAGINPQMITRPLGLGAEGEARLKLFQTCPAGTFHLTDIEGVYIDVNERASA